MKSRPVYYDASLARAPLPRDLAVDLCIYGATSAGIIAAVQAAGGGLSICLLAQGSHLGGLTAGGLGYTDFGNKAIIGGLAREFYRRVGTHYGVEEEWKFEPHVAEAVFRAMLREADVHPIEHQFLDHVETTENCIDAITMQSGLKVRAKFYIDATYEGDLMAKAGVPCTVGREGNARYDELLNGVQIRETHQFEYAVSPWRRENDPSSGLLPSISPEPVALPGTGDRKVQAYNFRMCLTRHPNRIPFPKPDDYQPEHYELLARYLRGGWRQFFRKFDAIRGGKTDTNNHGAVSTDFIGASHDYPEADYAAREKIFQAHVSYQQGLMWFFCHDERCPVDVRTAMKEWGVAPDEFSSTGHWPPQLYVREARRMVSDYVITEHDCRGYRRAEDAIGCGAYAMDSHNCQRVVVNGRVLNEGDVQAGGFPPYPVSYRSLIPPKSSIGNLFVPVCLSASHIAYGSVRMEPVFMVLGQSAAIAATLCQKASCAAQDLPYASLKAELEKNAQVIDLPRQSDLERQAFEVAVV